MTCNHSRTRILETRPFTSSVWAKRRRHECEECGYRFTTYETKIPPDVTVNLQQELHELWMEFSALQEKLLQLINKIPTA